MSYTMLARQSRVRQRKMSRLGAPDWLIQYLDFAEFQGKYGRCIAELCGVLDVMDAFQWPRLKP